MSLNGLTNDHFPLSRPRRHVRMNRYSAAAVLMLCKFGQYIRRGTTSRIAHVIYRDGFAEFTSKLLMKHLAL